MNFRIDWRRTHPARYGSIIRWCRYLCFAIGVLMLSYVAFVMFDARIFQAAQSREFQQELNDFKPTMGRDEPLHPLLPLPKVARTVGERAVGYHIVGRKESTLGRIEIASIGLTAMIQEGIDARTLRRAVGHIPGTSFPGEQGNVVITGHRDTFFRPLHKIRKDDEIRLTTLSGSYRYRVDSTEVVAPEDTEVLAGSDEAVLTLVTCYPFYFVGPAPNRFIVRAHMVTE